MDRLQFIATSLPSLPPSFLSSSLSKRGKDSNWTHKELDTTERLHFHLPYAKMRASLVAQLVKYPPAMQRPGFDPWVGKIPRRREGLPTLVFWLGEFHRVYSPWGHNELDITERF